MAEDSGAISAKRSFAAKDLEFFSGTIVGHFTHKGYLKKWQYFLKFICNSV